MAYFEWADDMVIDRGVIDDDHRQLIALVNQLHTATREGQGQDVVTDVLNELVRYTERHFLREEQVMSNAGLPRLAEHQQQHRELIAQLQDLQRKHAGGSITVAAQMSSLLRDWLSLHIRRSDRELRDVLKGRRPTGWT